ncbi:MAG: Ig-like domain-containing protein, partial [Acidimicrobiales bacterium]|nr:Ig-like domain-containing protein [Acidimicrobiales bacterium]
RRARARALLRLAVPMVLSAAVVVLAVTAVAQLGSASGPYRRTVDRGYAALAEPLVGASDSSGAQLVSFLHHGASLGRMAFFSTLDALASDSAALRRRYDTITPPDPETTVGCASAIAGRAAAVSMLRGALEGVLGGRTGLGVVDEGGAATAVGGAGDSLRSADRSWARCRHALRRAPGSAVLPSSVWVRDPGEFGSDAVGRFVSQVAGSRSLAPVHDLAVLDVVTEPTAVAGAQTLAVPATTSIVAHVVVADRGNVDENGVEVGGVATPQGAVASPVLVQRTVDLAAGRSTTVVLPGFAVQPGSPYAVEVVAESPRAGGTGLLVTRSIQVQVQQVATLTSVTSSPLVAVKGRPVTFIAQLTSPLSGVGTPTGTVDFEDDGATIPGCGARPVHDAQATCSATYPSASVHAITAAYSGDQRDAGSTSPAITLRVGV